MLTTRTVGKEIVADYTEAFSRVWIYLDNWALMTIAETPDMRERFLRALRSRGTLLFSFTNAIEIGGPSGDSAAKLKGLLADIENHWLPVEMNVETVIKREEKGLGRHSPISEQLLAAVLRRAVAAQERALVFRADGATLFSLSNAIEGAQDYFTDPAQTAAQNKKDLADGLRNALAVMKTIKQGPDAWLPSTPCAAAQIAVLRALATESERPFTDNDAFDIFHAMMAAAYADIAALDKRWHRLVAGLATTIKVPETFYAPELPQMIGRFEEMVARSPASPP